MARDLEVLAQSGPELIARARYGLRDGYPTSSMGGGGGNGVSDPVGELVIADKGRDPIRDAARRMQSCVENAGRELQYAVSALHNSQPVDPETLQRFRNVLRCENPYCGKEIVYPDRFRTVKLGEGQESKQCGSCYKQWDRTKQLRVPTRKAS